MFFVMQVIGDLTTANKSLQSTDSFAILNNKI